MNKPLNFSWNYIPNFEEAYLEKLPNTAKKVDLPHTNVELPLNYFSDERFQFTSTYEKIFDLEDYDADLRYFFYFEGIMAQADLYLNGHHLGHYVSGYLPIEVEFTKHAKRKDNRLVVVVKSHEDELVPPFGGPIDFLTYGGIYREAKILIRPKTYLKELLVDADMNGKINIRPIISNPEKIDYTIEYDLYLKGDKLETFFSNKAAISRPLLWSLDKPTLYELHGKLKTATGVDVRVVRFGFRSIEFRKDGFFINGDFIKPIGLNRHQSFPFIANAASKSLQYYDADKLKYFLGVNIVRSSHYPPSKHFLNRCDEIGLLVINEVPGWQFISSHQLWRDRFLDNVERMVITHYNHPSIILNSIRVNESADDFDLYIRANAIAREIDSSRPTTGVRNFLGSELLEDVYAFNDFSHSGKENQPGLLKPEQVMRKKDKHMPYIVTENNGHMFPTKSFDNEERRTEHAKRHLAVINSALGNPRIASLTSWVYADYQTHGSFGSGDHVCYHGVLDIFRAPKYAASGYIANFADYPYIKVLSSMNIGEYPEASLPKIWVLSNCEYLKVYKNNVLINTFYPRHDLYPHLPHPPFVIDEFITEDFNEDGLFSTSDAKKIKDALNYASINGLSNLKLKHKLLMAKVFKKYNLEFNDLVNIWNRFISGWGAKAVEYNFVGFINDVPRVSSKLGVPSKFKIVGHRYQEVLKVKDAYDTAIVDLRLLDEFGEVAQYSFSPFEVETSPNLQLFGPASTNFHAGTYLLMAKTLTDKPGIAWISVKSEKYGTVTFNFMINEEFE